MKEKYISSNFDDLLREEGLLEEAEAVAEKRIFVFDSERKRNQKNLNKENLIENDSQEYKDWKEKRKLYMRKYRIKNKAKVKEHEKNYRTKNKEKLNKISREYHAKNRDVIKERMDDYNKKYYIINKEFLKIKHKEYYEAKKYKKMFCEDFKEETIND